MCCIKAPKICDSKTLLFLVCGGHWYPGAGFPEAQDTLNCSVIQETHADKTDLGHVCLHLTVQEDTQALIKPTKAHATGEPQCRTQNTARACCVMACSLKGPVTGEVSYPLSGSPCSPTPEVLPALRRFTTPIVSPIPGGSSTLKCSHLLPQTGMSLLSAFITMEDMVMVTGMASK